MNRAKGHVWRGVLSSDELATQRDRLTISNAVRKADGIHVRIVQPERPLAGASVVEPTLEDAYLYAMSLALPRRPQGEGV